MTEKKYFGTDGIRGRVGVSDRITPEFMMKLGWAFGQTLSSDCKQQVMIGKDTRLSGYMLESALQAGLVASGVDVMQLGPMPTPGISFLTHHLAVSGGIVISASHNPYYDNGIKLFNAKGFKLLDEQELDIEKLLEQPMTMVSPDKVGKAKRLDNAATLYQNFCQQSFNQLNLDTFKLVVDCAHGAMYHIAPQVFQNFGATLKTIGVQPDGLNINHHVGSTHPQALVDQVKANPGFIGVAFDGDGDRVLMVDERGALVDGDDILYIAAKAKQRSKALKGGVIGTLMTNFGVERAFLDLNINFKRAQVGDRYVLDELNKNQWCLGGETSGHIIDLSKTNTGDGLMAALLVLEEMHKTGSTLVELRSGLKKCTQTLINVPASAGKQLVDSSLIQDTLRSQQLKLNGQGRIVLRSSGTEPLVRIMVEADEATMTETVANSIADVVKNAASVVS